MGRKVFEIFEMLKSGSPDVAVNATATVYTDAFSLGKHEYFSVFFQASSGGTIGLAIEIQVSKDNVTWVSPEDISSIDSDLSDSDEHNKRLSINKAPYIRFKIVGSATNAATTKVRIWLSA